MDHGTVIVPAPKSKETGDALKRPRRRRRFFLFLYPIYIGVLLFAASKVFWAWQFGKTSYEWSEEEIWCVFYTDIHGSGVLKADLQPNDDFFDVLVLGGSVIDQVANDLRIAFEDRLGDRLRFFNIAHAGHSSRDSLLKTRLLKDRPFDLILVYNGINDAPLNNVPLAQFKQDYTHCSWYESIRDRVEAKDLTIHSLTSDRVNNIARSRHLQEQRRHAEQIKTDVCVKANLAEIAELSRQMGAQVVLMTFAHYIAEGYNREEFDAGGFDYGTGSDRIEVEFWGDPDLIPAIMDAQNRCIRELGQEYPDALLIEQETLLPSIGENFSDVCHLSTKGRAVFTANTMNAVAHVVDAFLAKHNSFSEK